jgi:hypothetical protein
VKTRIMSFAAIFASVAAAQTFRVSGTVVDSESGAPLARTRVVLTGGPVPEQSIITSDGSFSFDVPKGKYTLLASHRGFGESYGQTRSGNSDSSIITGPDLDTTNLVLRWRAPVAIHGRILDEDGEPVFDAKVELFVEALSGGKRHIISLGRAESDELGNYSWSSLPGGTYYLAAVGEPWYFSYEAARNELTEAGKPPSPYALTYFPSGNDARAATPLILHPRAEVEADFTLRPAVGSNLHFVCPSSPCTGSLTLNSAGIGGAETLVRTMDIAQTNVIPGVQPGRYVVRYTGTDGNIRKEIEVAGADFIVEIIPKPAPTLTGKVTFQNPQDQPRHPVLVTLMDEDTGEAVAAALDANGNFSWPMVPVSHVRSSLAGADGFYITRISVDGASAKGGSIEVVDGAKVHVNLTASGETGRLNGFVMNRNKPVPMVRVVLAPAVASSDPSRYHGFQTDSDGSFDFATIPIGDYVLFAVDNQEFEYANSEAVRPYLAIGKHVRIGGDGVHTERIELAPSLHN